MKTGSTHPLGTIVVTSLLLLVVGCGKGDRPDLAPVSGTVTLDGQPLAGAAVVFRPQQGRTSRGYTNQHGQYELIYLRDIKGAKPGKNTVTITTATEESPQEAVPAKYNTQTELCADVQDDSNAINFELSSQQ